MATPLDPKVIVTLEELARSRQGRVKYKGTSSQAMGNRRVKFLGEPKGQDYSVLHHALRSIPNF